ncbi:hypothetical protein FZC76_14825 [Sutcliffiella horikoshii]|uniref:Uncharacterized protein n=1 Tax=Sutcliffiella horikoshii TaxID=79883 RepID=A0A5D4SWS2_9BACI|nr:hypothetical protein [Sutcliffiella horikoshii]TYS67830.1 hypothetical protein FZC76_14825 [Sutcliffiella horikoshii]
MSWKSFFIITIIIYIVLSLPGIFSIGYVIDWVPEATAFQKVKGYVVEGLTTNFLFKLLIAVIVGLVASLYRNRNSLVKS